jgi:hypothetical protein
VIEALNCWKLVLLDLCGKTITDAHFFENYGKINVCLDELINKVHLLITFFTPEGNLEQLQADRIVRMLKLKWVPE